MSNRFKTLKDVVGIEKGAECIRARITEMDGKRRLDLRTFYQDDDGEWKPTRRGVSVPEDLLEDLRGAVNKLCDKANEMREAGI